MDSVILKDMRGLAAAFALLALAACGGDSGEKGASAAAAGDSAAAPAAVAAAPGAAATQPSAVPAQPQPAGLDSAMTPAEAAKAVESIEPRGPVSPTSLDEYQLTMPKLRQLVQGGQNIAALQARRPELRDSMRVTTMDPNLVYQRLASIPDARAAVEAAGLSPREYTVAMAALIQAAMVHELRRAGRNPEVPVNENNVRFVSENWEEIQTMMRAAAPRPQAPQP